MKITTKYGLFLTLFGSLLTCLHYYLNLLFIPIGYFIMVGCGLALLIFSFYQNRLRYTGSLR